MTLCHIDGRPRGFCVATFYGSVSRSGSHLLYRVASFIVFVYSTFTSPTFRQIWLQKSIGVIPWLTYFLRCPSSQMPEETFSFVKCFLKMCCVSKHGCRNCSPWQISDLFTLYLSPDSLFTEHSDIFTHCQTAVLASCWAFLLQGLMFSLCRKQSIVTGAGGGRPLETNGLAFDK